MPVLLPSRRSRAVASRPGGEVAGGAEAARGIGGEYLVEIIASKHGPLRDDTTAAVLARLYALGIRPDWWKLEAQPSAAAWARVAEVVEANDPYCRGVVLLGLEAPDERLVAAFAEAAHCPVVKGFAIGRTIFAEAAEGWLSGRLDDAGAVGDMAARFGRLAEAWARASARRDAA